MKNYDLSTTTTYQAGATQAYVHRKLQKICDDILAPYGITKMQWLVIGTVYDAKAEGVRLSDLAEKLGTNLPYLTNTINLLEGRGILVRKENTQDSRSKLVAVADSYKAKCQEIEATLREGLRQTIYAGIDPVEFRVYIKVLNELAAVEYDKPSSNAKPTRKS